MSVAIAQNSDETAVGVVGRPFPKGVSGNPGGRPKGLARPRGRASRPATWLADRGFGRPTQTQALELSASAGFDLEGARERLAAKLAAVVEVAETRESDA